MKSEWWGYKNKGLVVKRYYGPDDIWQAVIKNYEIIKGPFLAHDQDEAMFIFKKLIKDPMIFHTDIDIDMGGGNRSEGGEGNYSEEEGNWFS